MYSISNSFTDSEYKIVATPIHPDSVIRGDKEKLIKCIYY